MTPVASRRTAPAQPGTVANTANIGFRSSPEVPAGSINPENHAAPQGGAGFLYAGPRAASRPHACLSYEVRFPAGFDFVRGGKLPGLYGGGAPSGGAAVDDDSGFSVRLMWRQDGAGEAYAYTIGKRNARYGDSIGRGSWHFAPGQWQHVELEIDVNTPGRADGALRVWVDDRLAVERRDVTYRGHASTGVDGMMFSTFFGGHDPSWATPREQRVEFRRFELRAPAP